MALFREIPDAAGLRARLIAASTMPGQDGDTERAKVDFAFIDGRSVRLSAESPERRRPLILLSPVVCRLHRESKS